MWIKQQIIKDRAGGRKASSPSPASSSCSVDGVFHGSILQDMNVRSMSMCSKTCSKKQKVDSSDQHRSRKLLTKTILEILPQKKLNVRRVRLLAWAFSQPSGRTRDACVVGQNPDEAELSQQKCKPELLSADTSGTDTFTHHQPEWMAQKQSRDCCPTICVVTSDGQTLSNEPLGGSNSSGKSMIWSDLDLFFLLLWWTFVAAMLKQLLTRPCYNLDNQQLFERFSV